MRGGHRGFTLSDIDGHRGAVLVTRWGMGQATLTRFLYVYNTEVLNFYVRWTNMACGFCVLLLKVFIALIL